MLSVRCKVGCLKHNHPVTVYSDSRDKVQTRSENEMYKDIVRAVQTKQKAVKPVEIYNAKTNKIQP